MIIQSIGQTMTNPVQGRVDYKEASVNALASRVLQTGEKQDRNGQKGNRW